MVISRLQGGLGNQMFQYAAGRALSQRLGAPLKLDPAWHNRRDGGPGTVRRNFELPRFDIRASTLGPWERLRAKITTTDRHVARHFSLRYVRARLGYPRFQDKSLGYDPDFETLGDGTYLDGFWQCERYFAHLRAELRAEFRLKDPVPLEADPCHRAIINHPAAVCVHVRRGDFLTDANFGVTMDPDYYRRAADTLRAQVPAPAFWIFSDDPEWCARHLDLGPQTCVVPASPSRSPCVDLLIMAAARHFIVANSSFSWWAAWLGAAPDKLVVAPARWGYGSESFQQAIVPTPWLRLE